MKTNLTILRGLTAAALMLSWGAGMYGAWPEGYYNSLEGKCGAELMSAVKAIAKNHTKINYGASTWNAFEDTDCRTENGVDYWWDMYSDRRVPVSAGRPDPNDMNIEHSVPNSWWGKTKNEAYCDLAHLNPSDATANGRKSNYPLAEVGSVTWTNGVTTVGTPKGGQGGGAGNCFEPADEYKGDFARAYMYMFTIYDDIAWKSKYNWMYDTSSSTMFRTWAKQLLVRWNSDDPVSEKERVRNDGIYTHQHNRNPFIDLPDLADHIWGSKANTPFHLDGSGTPDDPEEPGDDTQTYEWLSSTDTGMGDWTVENVTLPQGGTYVWSWGEHNGSHYLKGSAFISGTGYAALAYAWSPEVSLALAESAKISFKHAARYQTSLRELCKFVVRDTESGDMSEETIQTWPAAGNWNTADSGDIDLSAYKGKKVQVGFKYESRDGEADTWQISDVKMEVKLGTSGVDELIPDEGYDDSDLVEVWGNTIVAPRGARIFDLNGREYDGRNLRPGVYIVVKPSFGKGVKVLI